MDCKNALTEAQEDFEKATDLLRKKGQKVAEKRGERDAACRQQCLPCGQRDGTEGARQGEGPKGRWQKAASFDKNKFRLIKFNFAQVKADGVRFIMEETYGAKTAKLFEIRAYEV